jgi:hypothetical protein
MHNVHLITPHSSKFTLTMPRMGNVPLDLPERHEITLREGRSNASLPSRR